MAVPTPEQLERDLDDILHGVQRVRELYRLAEPNAYKRPRRGGASGSCSQSNRCGKCKGHGQIGNAQKQVTCPDCGGDGSFVVSDDTVGGELVATERFRKLLENLAKEVGHARNSLGSALAAGNDAIALLDPPPAFEVADVRLLAHPSSMLDGLRAKAAQVRRRQRGDESEVVVLDSVARRNAGVVR